MHKWDLPFSLRFLFVNIKEISLQFKFKEFLCQQRKEQNVNFLLCKRWPFKKLSLNHENPSCSLKKEYCWEVFCNTGIIWSRNSFYSLLRWAMCNVVIHSVYYYGYDTNKWYAVTAACVFFALLLTMSIQWLILYGPIYLVYIWLYFFIVNNPHLITHTYAPKNGHAYSHRFAFQQIEYN